MSPTHPTLLLPEVLDPGPEEARRELARELARREYQESLLDRVGSWVDDLFDAVGEATGKVGLIHPALAVALLVVVALLFALALSRLRRTVTRTTPPAGVFDRVRRTAAEHRHLAREAAERGDWDEVVLETVRALAAALHEQGQLPEQADLTVHELAQSAGASYPALAGRLRETAVLFDETRYGGRAVDADRARDVLALERLVADTTPARVPAPVPVSAVPR